MLQSKCGDAWRRDSQQRELGVGGAFKFLQELEAAGVCHRRAEPVRVLRRGDRQRVRVAVRLWALAAVRARRRAGCGSVTDDADVPAATHEAGADGLAEVRHLALRVVQRQFVRVVEGVGFVLRH